MTHRNTLAVVALALITLLPLAALAQPGAGRFGGGPGERHAEARDAFARAVEMEPRLDRAWIGLGDALYQLKEYG